MAECGGIRPTVAGGGWPGAGLSEQELISRAKRDREAFALLYDRYLEPVYRYCYRRLGSREAAEDATSRTFQRALGALPTCRERSFRGWLFAIAHNVLVDAVTRGQPEQPLDPASDLGSPGPSPEEALLAAEDRRALRVALGRLTPEQRNVVDLRLAGLSGAEIARALGRSLGSVKMLQLRALERLRELLNEEAGHGRQ